MADIFIDDEILRHTNHTISTANYSALRQYLLEKKPLATVTRSIEALLTAHFNKEKLVCNEILTQTQFAQQIQQDAQEIRTDKQEELSDRNLIEDYKRTIPVKIQKRNELDFEYEINEAYVKEINNELSTLERQLTETTLKLDAITRKRLSPHFQGHQILTPVNAHVHSTNVHTHHHSQVPQVHVLHTLPAQVFQDPYILETQHLTARRSSIEAQIDKKRAEKETEVARMKKFGYDRHQIDLQIGILKHSLTQDLPWREQLRKNKHDEREARKKARDANSTDVQRLLSVSNQHYLQTQILSKSQQLDKEKTRLQVIVANTSYNVYLTELERRLKVENDLQLNSSELQTLSMILNLVKNLQNIREEEQTLSASLIKQRSELATLEKKLTDSKTELSSLSESNRKLADTNHALESGLTHLNHMMHSADNYYLNSLGIGIASGITGLITGVLLFTMIFNPLFFIIPTVLGLVALIAMTIAIVKYTQKSSYDEQSKLNKHTATLNNEAIKDQQQKIQDLSQVTIPTLNSQIEACKTEINQIENKLKHLQYHISQLNNMSQNVSLSSNKSSFFGGGLSGALSAPAPKEPPPAYMLPESTYAAPTNFFVAPQASAPSQPQYSYNAPPHPPKYNQPVPSAPSDLASAPPAYGK